MDTTESYSRGVKLYHQGDCRGAIEALSQMPPEGRAIDRLGRYYLGCAHHQAGLQHARAGDISAAEPHLRRAVELVGPSGTLAAYLARVYIQAGRPDLGEVALDCRRPIGGHGPEGQSELAWSQYRLGRDVLAMLTLTSAFRTYPDSPILHVQMGLMLCRGDRHALAVEHFERAAACDPDNADAHYYLGLGLAADGRLMPAVRSLERAYHLRGANDFVLAHQLAVVARAAVEQGMSVTLHLRPAAGSTGHGSLLALAEYAAREGDFVTSLLSLPGGAGETELLELLSAVLSTALARHPEYADLHYRQSLICQRLGRDEDAVEHAERAVAINPEYVQGRIHLASLLAEATPLSAIEHLCRAIEAGGDYADVYLALGRLYQGIGWMAEARNQLERALEINPEYTRASEALHRLAA